jgi:hypothetical protein
VNLAAGKEGGVMRETFGKGARVPWQRCGGTISFTEAEVTTHGGKQFVELKCKSPACPIYDKPRLYDTEAVEIRYG